MMFQDTTALALVSVYLLNNSLNKCIKVGLSAGVPMIALVDKKSTIYLDKEEWGELRAMSSNILGHFKKKKMIKTNAMNEAEKENDQIPLKTKNINISLTKRGTVRCLKIEHAYPWTILLNEDVTPYIKLISPN